MALINVPVNSCARNKVQIIMHGQSYASFKDYKLNQLGDEIRTKVSTYKGGDPDAYINELESGYQKNRRAGITAGEIDQIFLDIKKGYAKSEVVDTNDLMVKEMENILKADNKADQLKDFKLNTSRIKTIIIKPDE